METQKRNGAQGLGTRQKTTVVEGRNGAIELLSLITKTKIIKVLSTLYILTQCLEIQSSFDAIN